MTENADVQWLRRELDLTVTPNGQWISLTHIRARRILDHIDQLDADNNGMRGFIDHLKSKLTDQADRRPTVHEIAVQMMAALVASDDRCLLLETLANESYRAAEALVAEGRRRDA